jgi:hypothetical protein
MEPTSEKVRKEKIDAEFLISDVMSDTDSETTKHLKIDRKSGMEQELKIFKILSRSGNLMQE